jgi:transcriptional regulator NrdR family protein
VVDSRPDRDGVRYLRWRICVVCRQLFETAEQATGKTLPLPTHHVDA